MMHCLSFIGLNGKPIETTANYCDFDYFVLVCSASYVFDRIYPKINELKS